MPLFHCVQLKILHISDNKLEQFPKAIESLINLIDLDVSRNCKINKSNYFQFIYCFYHYYLISDLSTIDESIINCKKLSILNLSANPLLQFPISLTQIVSLQELCLNDTQLEFIPANIGRLINLKVLEFRNNKISKIPKAISRLSQLYRLDIGQNEFIDFVSAILYAFYFLNG